MYSELSGDFRVYLALAFPPLATLEARCILSDAGMVAVWNEDHSHLAPAGCGACYRGVYGQDDDCAPTIGGTTLLRAEEHMELGGELGSAVRASLWLCPHCKLPQPRLLPNFR